MKLTNNSQLHSATFWEKVGIAIDSLSTVVAAIAGFLMLFTGLIITYEVFLRNFLHSPTIWVFDISGYILLWFGFLSAAYGLKEGSHISVDLLIGKMAPRVKVGLETVSYAFCLIYAFVMLIYSWEMALDAYLFKETAPTILSAPMYLVEAGMAIGSLFLVIQSLKTTIVFAHKWIYWQEEETQGALNNPWVVIPVYIALVLTVIWLYSIVPGIGLVLSMLLFLIAGVPVFTALGMVGVVGLFFLLGAQTGLPQAAAIGLKSLDSFVLLAVPLYVLVGQIMMDGGIGKELYDSCVKWVGHLPGGLGASTILACAIFAAISGSSVATAATIAMVAIPEMKRHRYESQLTYGTLAGGGTLGILIPPSAAMIIYSAITDESTGALFMGGVVPGIILTLLFAGYAVFRSIRTGLYEKMPPCSWKERFGVFKNSFWGLLTPVIIIFTIYTGICTPTEAAAVAVVYALLVSLVRKKVLPRQLNQIFLKSTRTSSMILMIVVGALQLGMITTFLQIPQGAVSLVGRLDMANWIIMVILCIIYLILGMFLEVISILLITMPIVYPIVIHMGFNGVWFGVFIVLLMEMALITPPVGLNMYVIQGVSGARMIDVIRGVLPFMLLLLIGLLLLWFVPGLAIWLPSGMGLGGL